MGQAATRSIFARASGRSALESTRHQHALESTRHQHRAGFIVVPQQTASVVERLGKFDRVLEPGLNFVFPILERVAYTHVLKEQVLFIPKQEAVSRDNVLLSLDGCLFVV